MPVQGLQAFTTEVRIHGKKTVPNRSLKMTKALAKEALTRIVRRSPVRTGKFHANWLVGINAPDTNVYPRRRSGAQAIRRGIAALSALKPFGIVYLNNNLPYAERLENGWSKQAPQGMVALTVAELSGGLSRGFGPTDLRV